MSFAVVDFETTGILPSHHHRIAELGITHVAVDGTITGRWETLINPERDLGAQRIHGISAGSIRNAPLFADIVPEFAAMLQGRVFVAHNALFDISFLLAEFARAGYPLPAEPATLCTMRLGAQFGLGGSPSLQRVCTRFGIPLTQAHTAGADSFAAAQLLTTYLRSTAEQPAWADYWQTALTHARSFAYPSLPTRGAAWQPRDEVPPEPHFLLRVSNHAAHPRATGVEADYLSMLDQCLIDRVISLTESDQLASFASDMGLSRFELDDLHKLYLKELAKAAWVDGYLSQSEIADLHAVAEMLLIEESVVDEIMAQAQTALARQSSTGAAGPLPGFTLQPGDVIVLTGQMTRRRAEIEHELTARGFHTHDAVTKKARLVVAADPDTISGKGRKARDYGIPIVTEQGLSRLLGQS